MDQPRTDPCPDCQARDLDCADRPKCVVCAPRRTTHLPDWGTCAHCVTDVDRALASILDLHTRAAAELAPRTAGDHTLTGVPGSRPPLDIGALDVHLGHDTLAVLEQWERWWRETLNLAPYGLASAAYAARTREKGPSSPATVEVDSTPTSRTLVGVVRFLRAQWPGMAERVEPPPDEFADEVRRLERQALAALGWSRFDVDPDPDATEPPDYAVPCPGCGGSIGMRRQPRDHHDTVPINCPRCGWHGTGEWLIRVAIASGARPAMSLAQVVDHYQVTERTVRRWVQSGRLECRRGMYRVNE